ncbi:phosphatidate cytidylyltransferase [Opitutus terrae]|uniref:Phosphatidate cytidylyltransferase n=1 Tax=Opitutus terrae (strain DSM 11246 / JCM 15787 / PB90-1) TaxID=452637 RepID=B1ZY06_OPITP|nr:phosphatidate cytidylyltransferase [Opitutus terrae]ACB75205.1 phosphatidate cytidylyltransferase [Opitutus terrae PB90-1]
MAKRILSTVLLWGLVAGALVFFRTEGGVALITLISVLTLREFYRLMQSAGLAPFDKLGMAFGGLITIAPWLEMRFGIPAAHWLALAVVVFSIRILGEREPNNRVEALAATLFGLVYVALMLQYLVRIVTPLPTDTIGPVGRILLFVWLVAVAKFCDVGALLTGLAIGKHKMSPQISPKKSWEGAVGGVVASMLIGAALAWWWRDYFPAHLTPLIAGLFAAPIAVIGIVSDLIESVIKRRATIKDSGDTIPGIGGVFDVSDSLILTAPLGYFLFGLA